MSNKDKSLHDLITLLASKIDGLAAAATDPSNAAAIATLRRDVDRLIEAESVAKARAKLRLRLIIATATALAGALGGTSDQWGPAIRAILAALGG